MCVCPLGGATMDFRVEGVGRRGVRRHGGKKTDLALPQPPDESAVPRKAKIWMAAAVVILGLGLAGAFIALKRAERWAARQKEQAAASAAAATAQKEVVPPPEDLLAKAGFKVSPIKLEKTPGSALVYAVGTVANTTDRQRFGVKVELDLLDAVGQRVGSATDYQQVIEPRGQWSFRALVVEKKAASVKLASIKEQQ